MKKLIFVMSLFFIISLLLTSCVKEQAIEMDSMSVNQAATSRSANNSNAQVIVLAAPSVRSNYYREVFQGIVDFQVDFANKINGRDEVIILVDNATRRYYQGRVPNYVLVNANIEDIWIRDFSPAIAGKQIKFNYLPDYLGRNDANAIDNSFERWYRNTGLQYGKKSKLILDGGNVVDNGNGRVIVTDRFLYDNPNLTRTKAKRQLRQLLGAQQVAIIKETPGDATGHSDGMVMWADENTILLNDQPQQIKNQILRELRSSFPGVNIVVLPDLYEDAEWQGFTSACNIYVNSLVTNDYIYVPTFNHPEDATMLNMIQQHTAKEVVEVPAESVCFMGGSVRCLSWQLDGDFANAILEE